MTAQELIAPIEMFAPISTQESWDNCGFSVGNPQKEVKSALLALDCTEEVIDEAIELGCDIVITHHPLIFKGVRSITPQNFTGRIITKALKNDIAVYSAHTNMDKASEGVSAFMADRLKLGEREPLTGDLFGIVGKLETPMEPSGFVEYVKRCFNLERVRVSQPVEEKIERVAVCGGSGHSFIKDAMAKGAQAYITGDITYHDFYCEKGFMIMDIGHYQSEYDVVKWFAYILYKKFPNFAVSISRKNNNPIYYY